MLFAIALLSCAPLLPQDDPAARAVVLEAAREQVPSGVAPEIRDFQADFDVTFFDKDPKGGSPIARTAKVTELWLRERGRTYYRRVLTDDAGGRTAIGSTGSGTWMRKNDDGVLNLDEDPGLKRDREELAKEMRRVEELVDHLFLFNLANEGASFRFARRGVPLALESGAVVVDEIVRTREGDDPILLAITVPSAAAPRRLAAVTIRPDAPDEERLRFDYHQTLRRPEGSDEPRVVVIPTRVEHYQGKDRVLSASARRVEDIKLNSGLRAKDFRAR